MSNLSDLLPSGGGGGTYEAVASGALGNGDVVVVNSDGTVSVTRGVSEETGTSVVFNNANSSYPSVAYDSANQKIVIAYQDDGNADYGTAVVGTVSGTSISFGSEVVFNSNRVRDVAICYDENSEKVVIAWQEDGSGYGTAIVGTVSGTSISFGSSVIFNSDNSNNITVGYSPAAQKVVIVYKNNSTGDGLAVVGTVSGTSISLGSAVTFESGTANHNSIVYDSNAQKTVVIYRNHSGAGVARVGTISGTSISFGSSVEWGLPRNEKPAATYDSEENKVVVIYGDLNSNHGTAIVGTVSGTTISFGSSTIFNTATTSRIASVYDSSAKKVVITYGDSGTSDYGVVVTASVSGNNVSFDTPQVFESSFFLSGSSAYHAGAEKVVVGYYANSAGRSFVMQPGYTNLTASNYIGISAGDTADGYPATIQTTGAVDDAQSGLTAGQAYYVQTDGTLGTTPADPEVFAGTAISSTQLIIKG